MAGEGINISLAEVSKTATSIKSLNTSLNDKLLEIKSDINSLNSSWQSDAARTFQENFNKYASKYFDNYKEVIDSYVKFLEKTVVENYDHTETQINNNASQFA